MRNGSGSHSALTIGCVDHGDRVIVSVAGEVDLATSDQLRVSLERVAHARVELDLRHTTFMDSSGLAALIDAHRRLLQVGAGLVLRDPNPTILRLLELTGVNKFIEVRMTVWADGVPHLV